MRRRCTLLRPRATTPAGRHPGAHPEELKIIRTKNTNMKDLDGKPIHAHGGGFLAPLQGGGGHKRWWWCGESAKGKPQNAGVNVLERRPAPLEG